MDRIKGKVTTISQREKNYSVQIDDEWYSGWDKCPCSKGDTISFTFKTNTKDDKTYKNIEEINVDVVGKIDDGEKTEATSNVQDKIGKQWAINAAIKCLEVESQPLTEENVAIKAALLIKIREGL